MSDRDALGADTLGCIDQGLTGILCDSGDLVRGAKACMTFVGHDAGEAKSGKSAKTGASGNVLMQAPGTGSAGTFAAGSLEMSNVDLAQEFTNLIIAQRGFQATSRVITTSDQVLEELVNIKR